MQSSGATALFPIVLLVLIRIGGGLGLGSIVLLLLGTQWYILFNVIAGAMAIPTDLWEALISNYVRHRRVSPVTLECDGYPPRHRQGVYAENVDFLVMNRFRHILAAGLVAIAFVSVATPALVCLIRGKSMSMPAGHSCCQPANKVQDSRPTQTENSCCVTAAGEDPSAPASVFKSAPIAVAAVAYNEGAVLFNSQFISSAPVDDASPPGCCSSSVLRI